MDLLACQRSQSRETLSDLTWHIRGHLDQGSVAKPTDDRDRERHSTPAEPGSGTALPKVTEWVVRKKGDKGTDDVAFGAWEFEGAQLGSDQAAEVTCFGGGIEKRAPGLMQDAEEREVAQQIKVIAVAERIGLKA